MSEENKIHIDSDWKAQARAEKEKLAQQEKQAAAGGEQDQAQPGQGGMPPANFETLVSTMATQALFAMGAIADPRTGQAFQDLNMARHHIDMLSVIEDKTKGNLSDEEQDMLSGTLYELRSRYIALNQRG